jgi:hypothetical protein
MRSKLIHRSIIGIFVSLYLLVSGISTIHVIEFFKLSNPSWLATSLAIAFELGAAASLASLIVLEKMNKTLVWMLFITITLIQMQGNMYHAFSNMENFQGWSELFGIMEEEIVYQKRVLSAVSGAILPLVALGFIKSLVDYIKPEGKITKNYSEDPINSESPSILSENFPQNSLKKQGEDFLIDANGRNSQTKETKESPVKESPEEEIQAEKLLTEETPIETKEEKFFYFAEDLEELKEWDVTLEDGLEDEPISKETEEERDEDHELDLVLNNMVEDLETPTEELGISGPRTENPAPKKGSLVDSSSKVYINPTSL